MRKSTLLLFLFPLIACSSFINENDGYEVALDKWEESKFSHYEFRYGLACICPQTNPSLIVVYADTVYQVLDPETRDSLMVQTAENMFEFAGDVYRSSYRTIDELFEIIKDARARDAYKLYVEYDESKGFPISIDIDYIKNAVDDEVFYSVSEYQEYRATIF